MHAAADGSARQHALPGANAVSTNNGAARIQPLATFEQPVNDQILPDKGIALQGQLAVADQVPGGAHVAPAHQRFLNLNAPIGPDAAARLQRAATVDAAGHPDVFAGHDGATGAQAATGPDGAPGLNDGVNINAAFNLHAAGKNNRLGPE